MSLFKPRYRTTTQPQDQDRLRVDSYEQDSYGYSPQQQGPQQRYPRQNYAPMGGVQAPQRPTLRPEPAYHEEAAQDFELSYPSHSHQSPYPEYSSHREAYRPQDPAPQQSHYEYAPLRQDSMREGQADASYFRAPPRQQPSPYSEGHRPPSFGGRVTESAYSQPQLRPQSPFAPLQPQQFSPQPQVDTRSLPPQGARFFKDSEKHEENRQTPTRFVLVIAAIIVLCAASWFMYRWLSSPRGQEVPTYTAQEGPFKVRPDDPGGLRIPHQEKLIYDRFSPQPQQPRQEQFLPEPEKPISPPDLYYPPANQPAPPPQAGPAPAAQTQPQVQAQGQTQPQAPIPPQPASAAVPAPQPGAPDYHPEVAYHPDGTPQQQVFYAPTQGAQHQASPLPEGEPEEGTDPTPAHRPRADLEGVEIPKLTTRKHRLQLASFENREEAISEMVRYKSEFATLLKDKTVTIQKSGKYWRILVGPYTNLNSAKTAQTKLRADGQEANIVGPSSN